MAWQAVALMASSTALKAGGSILGGLSAKYAADYNAKVARLRGQYSQQAAHVEELDLREAVARVLGTARAAAGASGFATESGSTQDALDAIVRSGELDAAMILHKGDIGSWESQLEATQESNRGRAAMMQGYFGAGQAVAQGASQYGDYKGWFK